MRGWRFRAVVACAVASLSAAAFGEAECDGWGDFRGIRVEGQLMKFATSVRAVSPDWKAMAFTATEEVANPRWSRMGNVQSCTGSILFPTDPPRSFSLNFRQTIEDVGPDTAKVTVDATANKDLNLAGVYYFLNLPAADYIGGSARLLDPETPGAAPAPVALDAKLPEGQKKYLTASAKGVRLESKRRTIEVRLDAPTEFVVQPDKFIDTDLAMQEGLRLARDPVKDELVAVYFPLGTGNLARGQTVHLTFTIKAGEEIDKAPVKLTLDAGHPGAPFVGVGGNFRLQSPADPAHVAYNLDNLRVAWGRVAMPLGQWQPREDAEGGPPAGMALNPQIAQQMEMARTLAQKKIPLIISIWNVPDWAMLPARPALMGRPFNIPARQVRPEKWDAVYQSIISYLVYLKKNYQVEPALLSLNECDLGIDVIQTPEEHAKFIRELGAKMAAEGLVTRMLLADACSPHGVKFVDAAMKDPEAIKYIGGISFHSWHDGTPEEYAVWGQNAKKLNVPLFVAEGGTDSDAYRYPPIFQEPWFALYEIDTYVQICNLAQPTSILHWQLTENYSILTGGGRGGQPLAPGRRFFQLKQLNLTPQSAPSVPISSDSPTVSACAYDDPAKGLFAAHLINNGATRQTTIVGLPTSIQALQLYVTDAKRGMELAAHATVADGIATFTLDAQSMTTVTGLTQRF